MILSVAPLFAQSPPASPNRPWNSPEDANPRGRGEALSSNCVPSSPWKRLLLSGTDRFCREPQSGNARELGKRHRPRRSCGNCPQRTLSALVRCSHLRRAAGRGSFRDSFLPLYDPGVSSLARSQLHHLRFWRPPRANRCGARAVTGGKLRLQRRSPQPDLSGAAGLLPAAECLRPGGGRPGESGQRRAGAAGRRSASAKWPGHSAGCSGGAQRHRPGAI